MDIEMIDQTNEFAPEYQQLVYDILQFAGDYMKLPKNTEMSVTFMTNEDIRKINKEYRDTDRATDVISFAIEEDEDLPSDLTAEFDIPRNIGDLMISPEKAEEQAKEYGHSFERELGYTAVHGFLHLNGYDHIETTDAEVMIPLQEKILDAYGLKR